MKRASLSMTREGWYYLGMMGFIVAGAVIRDINLLYIMAGMMLGPLLLSFYASGRSLRRIQAKRRFDPLVAAGDPLYVEITVSKPTGSPRGLGIVMRDLVRRKQDGARTSSHAAELFFAHVPAGATRDHSYCLRLHRRGAYELGPLRASTGMPLGLVRAAVVWDESDTILVSPRLGSLQPAWARFRELPYDGGQKSIRRQGNAEGDFYGMREWRTGDSRNWIHWRTSAKRQKLMVRQFQQPVNQDMVVVLDLYHPSNRPVAPDHVEQAISFAATLIAEQGRLAATQMSVASASAGCFTLHGLTSPVFQREVMERMAVIDADTRDRLPAILAEVLPRVTSRARIVLISLTPRDLQDARLFEELWKRTEAKQAIGNLIQFQIGTPELEDVFLPPSPATTPHDGQHAQGPSGAVN